MVHLHVFFCCVLTILFLFCCAEESRGRCDAWLITWKKTLWVKHSVLQHTNACTDAQIHDVWMCNNVLILSLSSLDGGFWERLETGDPPHWRQWPVSVLQWPRELLHEVVTGNSGATRQMKMKDVFFFVAAPWFKQPHSVVWCPVYRAVSWYHSPNGPAHWSRIIKLCEQPSPNCFIVSE